MLLARYQASYNWVHQLSCLHLRTNFCSSFRTLSIPADVSSDAARRQYTKRQIGDFVDRTQIIASAGRGGDGCTAFTRGPNREMVPPDGGSGGNGGSVYVEARHECTSLRMSNQQARAGSGKKGMKSLRTGATGEDRVVPVPLGTVVRLLGSHDDEFGAGLVLCDLNEHGQKAEVARGGIGGRGNAYFKSSTNRSPYDAQKGTPGETKHVELELKTIADVGLVGFPNAGKSTLLRAMSHAKPKVANYPFTTLRPHIGVASCKLDPKLDESRCTIADIPGLIEGAHDNRGLGHEFLRHIERTSMLIYVLDMSKQAVSGEVLQQTSLSPLHDLNVLKRELEMYQEGLSSRSSIVVANKMDTGAIAVDNLEQLVKTVPVDVDIFPVSALESTGVDDVIRYLIRKLATLPKQADTINNETSINNGHLEK